MQVSLVILHCPPVGSPQSGDPGQPVSTREQPGFVQPIEQWQRYDCKFISNGVFIGIDYRWCKEGFTIFVGSTGWHTNSYTEEV